MFKRGVLVLLLASIVAMSAVEVEGVSKSIDISTNLKHPVVKSVSQVDGKIQVVLKEGAADEPEPTDEDDAEPTEDEGEDETGEDESEGPDEAEGSEEGEDEGEEESEAADEDEDEDGKDDRKVSVGNETISDGKGGIIGKKAHKKAVKAHKKDAVSEDDDGDDDDDEDHKHHKKALKAHKKGLDGDDDGDDDTDLEDDDDDDSKHHKKAAKAHKKAVKAHKKDEAPDDDDDDLDLEDDDDIENRKHHKKAVKAHKAVAKKAMKKAHKKDATVEKTKDGEIRHYKFGTVEIVAQQQPSGKKAKKAHKKDAPVEKPAEDANVQEKEVNLEKGESLILEYRGHVLNFTATDKDTLLFTADDKETVELPKAEVYDIDVPGTLDEGNKTDNSTKVTTAPLVLKEVKGDLQKAKKSISSFTELATRVTGNTVPKEAAPIVFVCGLVGALAAIVGVAAVALGRVHHDAEEDPASVLADAEVEDVEAGVQKKSDEEETEDAPAEKSDSLSDSESDSDVEEGTFANDKTVSV